jgi:hypothetical protein
MNNLNLKRKKMNQLNSFIEYIKIHEISLLQDAEKYQKLMDDFEGDYDSDEYRDLEIEDILNTGELTATRHLLSVAEDMIKE